MVITLGFTLEGTLESFDATAQSNMKRLFERELDCAMPTCSVELNVLPSSVRVEAVVRVPEAVSADVLRGANRMAALNQADLSSLLGWRVQETISIKTRKEPMPATSPPPALPAPGIAPFIPIGAVSEQQQAEDV